MAKKKKRVAINGLGRIGRLALRIFLEEDKLDVVAFNDLADTTMLAHLLKYDTAQGGMTQSVRASKSSIRVGKKSIKSFAEKDPENLPWKELEIDIVVECTGFFRSKESASKHIKAGAEYVVISAPAGKDIDTVVLGVNDKLIKKGTKIYSNASCTTNCLAPMAKTLHEAYGIKSGIMNTIHAYTADQNLQDGIHHKDARRARAAALNMVPTTSGATNAVEMVYPALKGKMTGGAVRVPVITGSLTEFFCTLEKKTTVEEINLLFKNASKKQLKGILRYTEDPIVSSDIIHDPHSCIFDADLTTVMGDMIKIVGWYDNEYGYASRLTQMVTKLAALK